MLQLHVSALKASTGTLVMIGLLASMGSGLLTIGLGMDTPWAPWERPDEIMFPPVLFTMASFVAAVAFCATTVVFHTLLKTVTDRPDWWWRMAGGVFLFAYGAFSFTSGTVEAAIMLNSLHLVVGLPALTLLPAALRDQAPSSSTMMQRRSHPSDMPTHQV